MAGFASIPDPHALAPEGEGSATAAVRFRRSQCRPMLHSGHCPTPQMSRQRGRPGSLHPGKNHDRGDSFRGSTGSSALLRLQRGDVRYRGIRNGARGSQRDPADIFALPSLQGSSRPRRNLGRLVSLESLRPRSPVEGVSMRSQRADDTGEGQHDQFPRGLSAKSPLFLSRLRPVIAEWTLQRIFTTESRLPHYTFNLSRCAPPDKKRGVSLRFENEG
jgi:hypothetical protein